MCTILYARRTNKTAIKTNAQKDLINEHNNVICQLVLNTLHSLNTLNTHIDTLLHC